MIYVIVTLATWRIASLLVNEDGPFDIFARFRKFIGVYYDYYSRKQGKNVVARAFTCVWCLSVWIALAATFFSREAGGTLDPGLQGNIRFFFFEWLAVSAGAILIDELIEALGRHNNV